MSTPIKTVQQLAFRAAQDPRFAANIGEDPVRELNRIAAESQIPDTWIYRIVVLALGLAVLVALVGAIVVAKTGGDTALNLLTAIGSAAVGALAGLLAPSPSAT